MISRCIALIDQPDSTNRRASQSRSGGLVGRSPSAPKLSGVRDESLAEVPAPDPVDHHPAGERMVVVDQPACQLQPAAL